MNQRIEEQVVGFYDDLYQRIFTHPFGKQIPELRRRKAMARQVEETADASSQALVRLLVNERLPAKEVADILDSFDRLSDILRLNDIENTNIPPSSLVDELLPKIPQPKSLEGPRRLAVFRLALLQLVQVLLLVGPVMAEWRKLNFSSEFGLLTRVVEQLNRISEQLNALGRSGREAEDESYEVSYRDYLLQRFYRVEAGTVKMTTHLYVDLDKLFVLPNLRPYNQNLNLEEGQEAVYMDLDTARARYGTKEHHAKEESSVPFLDHVGQCRLSVIIGAPGSGKSTALEWLQLQLAAGRDPVPAKGKTSIPLLLRMRQLDPKNLPVGADLVEQALTSHDQAMVMPAGWLERQLNAGRIFFMLDGLDETEPHLRDQYVLPWLSDLRAKFPDCSFLVSSRPSGYPPGILRKLGFKESELLDFNDDQIGAYLGNWCTAVRLSQNEPLEEAEREGKKDGTRIYEDFKGHPYIRDLARNPLMLSAICLVNYFEGGQLPRDRATLYKLCVEGLMHNWDQRRGILSEFSLSDKLRACREIALEMQLQNRAEFEHDKVVGIFGAALGDEKRGQALLEHVRHRAGLLLERRPGVFTFAHLTFQEYLAALGVYEGNQRGITIDQIITEHEDNRWREVIPLYCGLAPVAEARKTVEKLINQEDTRRLSLVLAESYLAGGLELAGDREFRVNVLERIAVLPENEMLQKFPREVVAPVVNRMVGRSKSRITVSECFGWLDDNPEYIDEARLRERLKGWQNLSALALSELIILCHKHGSESVLVFFIDKKEIYAAKGHVFYQAEDYVTQAEMAFLGLIAREQTLADSAFVASTFLMVLRILVTSNIGDNSLWRYAANTFIRQKLLPADPATWPEFAALTQKLAKNIIASYLKEPPEDTIAALNDWADFLEERIRDGQVPSRLS